MPNKDGSNRVMACNVTGIYGGHIMYRSSTNRRNECTLCRAQHDLEGRHGTGRRVYNGKSSPPRWPRQGQGQGSLRRQGSVVTLVPGQWRYLLQPAAPPFPSANGLLWLLQPSTTATQLWTASSGLWCAACAPTGAWAFGHGQRARCCDELQQWVFGAGGSEVDAVGVGRERCEGHMHGGRAQDIRRIFCRRAPF